MRTVIFFLILLFCTPNIYAQDLPDLTEAEQQKLTKRIKDAKAKYNGGEFQAALTIFSDAYSAYPHPDFLYRIALCHERLGNDQEAVRFYRQFLAAVPEAPERPRIEKTIETIEKRIAQSSISVTTNPSGATVYVNDVTNGAAGYSPTALKLSPGTYTIIVERDGFQPVEELVELKPGQSVQLRYQLNPIGGSVDNNGNTDGGVRVTEKNPYVPWTILFTTLGVSATVFTFIALNQFRGASDELAKIETNRPAFSREAYDDAVSKENTWLILTYTGAGVAAVTLMTAYIFWNRSSYWRRQQGSALVPVVSGDGIGLGWVGRF